MMKVLLIDNLILKLILPTFRLDVPQGEMNLDWMGLYFFIGYSRGQSTVK